MPLDPSWKKLIFGAPLRSRLSKLSTRVKCSSSNFMRHEISLLVADSLLDLFSCRFLSRGTHLEKETVFGLFLRCVRELRNIEGRQFKRTKIHRWAASYLRN